MARTKKVPFADALAIWAETSDEMELRDGMVALSVYIAQRHFDWKIKIEPVAVKLVKEETKMLKEAK